MKEAATINSQTEKHCSDAICDESGSIQRKIISHVIYVFDDVVLIMMLTHIKTQIENLASFSEKRRVTNELRMDFSCI